MQRDPSPSADTGGAAETTKHCPHGGMSATDCPYCSSEVLTRYYERALGNMLGEGLTASTAWVEQYVASLRARLAESETKAPEPHEWDAIAWAIRYLRSGGEPPSPAQLDWAWAGIIRRAALTREPTP